MKRIILFILLLNSGLIYGQDADTIEWRESYKLRWEDFKASPDESTSYGAWTGATIAYKADIKNGKVICVVHAYFERQRSWVKNKAKLDYVLKHEQGHFDIWEIYTRKIRKVLSEKNFSRKNIAKDITAVVERIRKKAVAQQEKYDKATGFAFNEKNQKKWTKNTADELKELEQYRNATLILNVK